MCDDHNLVIEQYFQSLVNILEISHSSLPKKSSQGKMGKDFWSDSLTRLKDDSVAAFNTWSSSGRPSSCPIFDRKKHCHYLYKAELRRQRRSFAESKRL